MVKDIKLHIVIFNIDRLIPGPNGLTISDIKQNPVGDPDEKPPWPYDIVYESMAEISRLTNWIINYVIVYSTELRTYKLIRWNPKYPKTIVERLLNEFYIQDLIKDSESCCQPYTLRHLMVSG